MSKTIVWLDHEEARIFHLRPGAFDEINVNAPTHHVHRHPKGASEPKDHPEDAKRFFQSVAQVLEVSEEVLVVGPGTAKLHFLRYTHSHAPRLELRIVGVETADHPSDGQLIAHAREYFVDADRAR
jgi:stalled ribosome rescue protein Dom34